MMRITPSALIGSIENGTEGPLCWRLAESQSSGMLATRVSSISVVVR